MEMQSKAAVLLCAFNPFLNLLQEVAMKMVALLVQAACKETIPQRKE